MFPDDTDYGILKEVISYLKQFLEEHGGVIYGRELIFGHESFHVTLEGNFPGEAQWRVKIYPRSFNDRTRWDCLDAKFFNLADPDCFNKMLEYLREAAREESNGKTSPSFRLSSTA